MTLFNRSLALRGVLFAGIAGISAAMLLTAAGCNREGSDTTTESTADKAGDKLKSAAGKTTSDSSPEFSDQQIFADEAKARRRKGPAPVEVKHHEVVAQWDVPAQSAHDKGSDQSPATLYKSPRMRQVLKLLSDGQEIPDGKYEEWYPNGQKLQEGEYIDGLRQGPWKLWHENGQVRKTEKYLNGKLEGAWQTFADDGKLEGEVSFHDNERNGRWVNYAADGKTPTRQEEYKAGKANGAWIRYFANGQKESENQLVNGKRDGEQTTWFEDGQKKQVQHYKNDLLDGHEVYWRETGDKWEKWKEFDWKEGQMVSSPKSPPAEK